MSVSRLGLGLGVRSAEVIRIVLWGACLTAAQRVFDAAISALDRLLVSRAVIDSRDEAFKWVQARLIDLVGRESRQFSVAESSFQDDPIFAPAHGSHLVWWRGRPFLVCRTASGIGATTGNLLKSERLESISISTPALSPHILHGFITEARDHYSRIDSSRTVVYSGNQYGNWNRLHSRPSRSLDSVIMDAKVLRDLVADISSYLADDTERWYAERGIPYRRGYLLYGPPGTGKSSLTLALAGQYRLPVYLISLTIKGMNDEGLLELLGNMPRRAILLLEDVDVAFPSRSGMLEGSSSITPSGLLNALDGAAAQEGRIVIMTTNHRDHLDPALVRPGRVDLEIPFRLATKTHLHQLFVKFYGSEAEHDAQAFASPWPENEYSIAQAQGYLMQWRRDPKGALRGLPAWLSESSERRISL
ncbi:hypothetical protein PYCC9005_004720 [Savitreella phatthalungensis]